MRTILVFCFCFLLWGCYEEERKCSDFKTGHFEFEAVAGTEILKTIIHRTDSIEIETFRGKSDTSTIRWINDCEYVLQKLNPKNQAEKKAILIKILSTSEDEYRFEFSEVGKTQSSQGVARRIR